ncbi:hypothetical protein E2320_002242 [Naja naja]|nr:hypothetical protein E2320_002242 [Naja naja]
MFLQSLRRSPGEPADPLRSAVSGGGGGRDRATGGHPDKSPHRMARHPGALRVEEDISHQDAFQTLVGECPIDKGGKNYNPGVEGPKVPKLQLLRCSHQHSPAHNWTVPTGLCQLDNSALVDHCDNLHDHIQDWYQMAVAMDIELNRYPKETPEKKPKRQLGWRPTSHQVEELPRGILMALIKHFFFGQ